MTSSDHEFGSKSTDLKLSLVEDYLKAFTTALRPKFSQLWYIDAFAGTGERTIVTPRREADILGPEVEEKTERRRGSAKIAIDIEPNFDRLIFIEMRQKHSASLRELRLRYPTRKIEVISGEANAAIIDLLKQQTWSGTRAVMFLDPYGMSVEWRTLEAIRRTEAIDVWYLVSLTGFFRQATRNAEKLDESKRLAITRMIGTPDWETDWYGLDQKTDLFGQTDERIARTAQVSDMESYFGARLRTLFPKVLPPLRLNDARGIPQFALFFAISNPEPKAIGLATRIANHILKSGNASHVRSR